jgi:hypothetical protein
MNPIFIPLFEKPAISSIDIGVIDELSHCAVRARVIRTNLKNKDCDIKVYIP